MVMARTEEEQQQHTGLGEKNRRNKRKKRRVKNKTAELLARTDQRSREKSHHGGRHTRVVNV